MYCRALSSSNVAFKIRAELRGVPQDNRNLAIVEMPTLDLLKVRDNER